MSGETEGASGTLFTNVLNLKTKILNLELHAGTLGDYCKVEMIPRSLRLQKTPAMFANDLTFCEKWVSILNKCSTNLMLLIEKSGETIDSLKLEAEELEKTLKEHLTEDEFNVKTKELEEALAITSSKTRELKQKKFERDTRDYKNNNVYKFLKQDADNMNTVQRKSVSWTHPLQSGSETSEFEIDSGSTSGEEQSRNQRPFLERRTKTG